MVLAVLQTILVMLITFFVYYSNGGDLLAPACLACFASILCSAGAIYDCWRWSYQLGAAEVFVFSGGLLCFVVPATFFNKKGDGSTQERCKPIIIPKVVTYGVIAFGLVAAYLYVRAIMQVAGGSGDWSQTMQSYRHNVAYGDADDQIPSSVSRLFKLFMAFAYAYVFIFMNDLVVERKARWAYLLPGLIYCGASLSQASRGQIIAFLFASVIMFWVLRKRYTGKTVHVPFSVIAATVVVIVAGLALFAMANELVGRTTAKTPLDSVMTYIGGSVVGLDMFLDNPGAAISPNNIFGAETFRGLYSFLGRTFDIPEYEYTFQLEYRYANGTNIGNLYTAYRYYLHDFGALGLVILTALQGLIFGVAYRHITVGKFKDTATRLGSETIIFSYLALSVAFLPIADYLFHQYFNPTTLLTLLMFIFAIFILSRLSRLRIRRNELPKSKSGPFGLRKRFRHQGRPVRGVFK